MVSVQEILTAVFYLPTGSRASILDFNKSSSLFTASLQVKCQHVLCTLILELSYKYGVLMNVACSISLAKIREPIIKLMFSFSRGQSWAIDNVVVPLASGYGLTEEYKYLKSSISQYLTGLCAYFLLGQHVHERAGLAFSW